MADGFKVGAMVKWESQAAGRWAEKVGRVEAIVPPMADPPGIRNPGFAREHESYTVRVGSKLYWPRAKLLRPVAAPPEDRLRDAAPEMRDALQWALRHAPDHDNECDRALCVRSPCWPVRARAALAKASSTTEGTNG